MIVWDKERSIRLGLSWRPLKPNWKQQNSRDRGTLYTGQISQLSAAPSTCVQAGFSGPAIGPCDQRLPFQVSWSTFTTLPRTATASSSTTTAAPSTWRQSSRSVVVAETWCVECTMTCTSCTTYSQCPCLFSKIFSERPQTLNKWQFYYKTSPNQILYICGQSLQPSHSLSLSQFHYNESYSSMVLLLFDLRTSYGYGYNFS